MPNSCIEFFDLRLIYAPLDLDRPLGAILGLDGRLGVNLGLDNHLGTILGPDGPLNAILGLDGPRGSVGVPSGPILEIWDDPGRKAHPGHTPGTPSTTRA